MPIDPRIPLGAGGTTAPFNPLEAIQQILAIKETQSTLEARRRAGEEARQKAAAAAAKAQAYEQARTTDASGKVTIDRQALLRAAPAELLPELQQQFAEDDAREVQFLDSAAKYVASKMRTVRAANYAPEFLATTFRDLQQKGMIDAATVAQYQALPPEQTKQLVDALAGVSAPALQKVTTVNAQGQTVERFVEPSEGAEYVQPTKEAPQPSLQQTDILLNGQRLPAAFNPQTGQILYGGQDVTTEARLIPPASAAGPAGQRPITQTAEANLITRLNSQWTKASTPRRELGAQVQTMRAGLAAGERGDLAQANEAVLQPFLKLLDQNSVVRESEFWRLQEGLSLLARAQGVVQRLQSGGFVSLAELRKFAQLGEEIATRYDAYVTAERGRIGRVAERYNIPEELVFETVMPPAGTEGAAATGGGGGGRGGGGLTYDDYKRAKGQ